MEKKKNFKEIIKINNRAIKIIYKRYPQMVISRFSIIIWEALTPYVTIYLSALVIDELVGNKDIERLKILVFVTLISGAIISLISAILNKWKKIQEAGFWLKISHIFSEKLLNMDYVDLDKTETADLLAKIRQNHNSTGWGFNSLMNAYDRLISSFFIIAGGVSLTVSLFLSPVPESAGKYTILNNPLFILLIIAVMFLITYIAPALSNKARSYWAISIDLHNLSNRLFGFFGFLGCKRDIATDVRIYRQDKICEKYNLNKESAFCSKGVFAKYSKGPIGFYSAMSSAVSVIFTGVVYIFVCLKAWAGAFSLGDVTKYVSSITKVSNGVSEFISSLGDMKNNSPFLEQIFKFLDIPNNMYQGSLTVEKRNDYKYEIEFRNVSFKYPNSDNYSLRNVNIKFEIGKRLAVVGINGSGKTTFIKLLCRLYDPTEGEILLNGIDIRKYNYIEYMMIFSIVFQDFKLFSLKLGENVATSSNYDDKKVIDALIKVGFKENLDKMPKGIETYLYKDYDKNGINVSGGEAQKIAIARAFYKNAPFIILDEPTAALDPIAESEIYSKFNEIVGDKTAIYISHRLSSCKFCDEILVFDNGLVIQQGTHNKLILDKNGKYYELWYAQAQYYTK